MISFLQTFRQVMSKLIFELLVMWFYISSNTTVVMHRRAVSMVRNPNRKGVQYLQRQFQYQDAPSDNIAFSEPSANPSKRPHSGSSVKKGILGKSSAILDSRRKQSASTSK